MGNSGLQMSSKPGIIVILEILVSQYCKYYSQGIVVFLVSNAHVESKLLTDLLFMSRTGCKRKTRSFGGMSYLRSTIHS